jgi:glucose-6-phosphate 1-dehydrogenase
MERNMREPDDCAVVIFGASGDLTRRKLAPAIYNLALEDLLPDGFAVVGYGRTEMTDDEFRRQIREGLDQFSRTQPIDEDIWNRLSGCLHYQPGQYDEEDDLADLSDRLSELDEQHSTQGNRVFYLAIPPDVVVPILEGLSSVGALERRGRCVDSESCFERVVFEKPFGHDLQSARELNASIEQMLVESQIYRMDHYLGKETVQNISVLRFANSIFENVWSSETVNSIYVTVAEDIGVGKRAGYFDQTGILRDILQNHLLQLLTLVTMEPPASLDADAIRDEKVKVLHCLRKYTPEDVSRSVVRGQYGEGEINGEHEPGYRSADGVDEDSTTETFVALRTYIDNWRWAGVPIYLTAGKRLPRKLTEIAIEFKAAPRVLFGARDGLKPNRLKIRVQPDEGVSLRFTTKVPGMQMDLRDVLMDFPYGSAFPAESPEAYERLLLAVMAGRSDLFARRDEVEGAWEFAQSILDAWAEAPEPDFPNYAPGTWGPISTEDFFNPRVDYSNILEEKGPANEAP